VADAGPPIGLDGPDPDRAICSIPDASKRPGIASLASPGVRTSELSTRPPVASYGPGAASVPRRACLAILRAADAIAADEIGPTSADSVRAKIDHDEFIDSLGG
jgi:hypothetical protein